MTKDYLWYRLLFCPGHAIPQLTLENSGLIDSTQVVWKDALSM